MLTKTNKKKNKYQIFSLGITSFFNDASSEMIKPILPMFITALGGGSIVIGLIGGIREFVANIITIFSGYWSDKIGRRRIFVFFGYFIPSICKILLAFSKTWGHVLFLSSIERTGKGLRTASRDAILAETSPYKKGLSFGIHRAFDTAGGIIGTLLAFLFVWYFHFDFKTIIMISALIGFISLIPLSGIKHTTQLPTNKTLFTAITTLSKKLQLFIIISSIFALADFSYMFLLLKTKSAFSGKFAVVMPILFYLIFNICYAIGAIPLGMLTDIIGRRKVIIFGYFLFSTTCIGFMFAHTIPSFVILFALYGIVYAIIQSNQRAFVADEAIETEKATSLGAFHTSIGIFSLIGNILAGFIWKYASPEMTFLYGSIISIIAVLLFLFFSFIYKQR